MPIFLLLNPLGMLDVQVKQAPALRGTKQVALWAGRPDKSKESLTVKEFEQSEMHIRQISMQHSLLTNVVLPCLLLKKR